MDGPKHSEREARFLIIGYSLRYRVLIVVFFEKTEDRIRIISARPATSRERRMYEQGIDN
ncbi:MAG: BrnT family toxin [Cyanobacteria bacterium P01_F01_bin.150]